MSKEITITLTDDQHSAISKVAQVMRSSVEHVAKAAALQDIERFELDGDRESYLLQSLRNYVDGEEVPEILI